MRWNPSTVDFEGYDGTNWKSLTGQPNTNQTTYQVGDRAQGGIVYWVTPDGTHGKVIHLHQIVTESGQTATAWHTPRTATGAVSSTLGQQNTLAIINKEGHIASAAIECYNLVADGYDDWYLPAKDEIEDQLLPNISIVRQALLDWGGSDALSTWTSTEISANNSFDAIYYQDVVVPHIQRISKHYVRPIRAIRSF